MNTTQFVIDSEVCTATMTSHLASGENFYGPISVGFYPGAAEVWIQNEGHTINIQAEDVDQFCRELKRAKKLAMERNK